MKKLFVVLFFFINSFHVQADNLSDSNQLFDWVELNYPQYFSPSGQETFQLENYWVRYYENTNTYIGTSGEDVYVYGDEFGGLLKVGQISDFIQTNTLYHLSEFYPVQAGNRWVYTTGERYFTDESFTNDQGQTGLLYATDTYEYSLFMMVNSGGTILAQYEDHELSRFPIAMEVVPETMKIGESITNEYSFAGVTHTTTLVSKETILVPAGEFETIKYKVQTSDHSDDGVPYSFVTYIWAAKGVGIVKIDREDLFPPKDGCILVCRSDNDFSLVNQPAELISAIVDGVNYPEILN